MIKTFILNPFQVNTYIVSDKNKNSIIIDPACYGKEEEKLISDYIDTNSLSIKHIVLTHAHIDHILGANFIQNRYKPELIAHKESELFINQASDYGMNFGFTNVVPPSITKYINDGDIIQCGEMSFQVLYTPGHANGSICLYSNKSQIVFTGDVLFNGSIGRTDLPTGNYNMLIDNIQTKIFTLPDNTTVYSGHGPSTSILQEKTHNPFFN